MSRLLPLLVLLSPTLALADENNDESSLPPLSVYGFARIDVLSDDAKMSDVKQPMFVERMAPAQNSSEMSMTPQLSRVGLSIDDWEIDGMTALRGEGKIEVDFAGGSGTNAIRLRQAYAEINAFDHVRLLAGQTDDLFSPLIPTAQNDTQLLFAGNVGDRRPQLRLVLENKLFRAGVAVATSGTVDRAGFNTSTPSQPMLEWVLEAHHHLRHAGKLVIGVSGHTTSEQEMDGSRRGSSSVNMHVFVPIISRLAIQGEGYLGANAAQIGGGIGQGIDPVTNHRIGAKGGWLELVAAPTKRHTLAFGSSIDTANEDDLQPGDRRRNGTLYGVIRYKPISTLQLALEYLYWRTSYLNMGNAEANRFDMHLSVFF
jgi:hypothetical protein